VVHFWRSGHGGGEVGTVGVTRFVSPVLRYRLYIRAIVDSGFYHASIRHLSLVLDQRCYFAVADLVVVEFWESQGVTHF
jgi:hypothetical protein